MKKTCMAPEVSPKTSGKKWKWILLSAILLVCIVGGIVLAVLLNRKTFPAVPRTAEEAEVVLKMGETEVCYDLYRYLFFGHKQITDLSLLSDAEAFQVLHEKTCRSIAELYAAFRQAENLGVSLSDNDVKKLYQHLLELTKSGGEALGTTYSGFPSEADYRVALAENHMSDAVYRLYLQKIALEYYSASAYTENHRPGTAEILDFFRDETKARRVTYAFISLDGYLSLPAEDARKEAKKTAERAYSQLSLCENDADAFIQKAIQYSFSVQPASLETGFYLGRYDSDDLYKSLSEALFSMAVGEVSPILETAEGYFILYRLPGDEEYLTDEQNLDKLKATYLADTFYREQAEIADLLYTSLQTAGRLDPLPTTPEDIS